MTKTHASETTEASLDFTRGKAGIRLHGGVLPPTLLMDISSLSEDLPGEKSDVSRIARENRTSTTSRTSTMLV